MLDHDLNEIFCDVFGKATLTEGDTTVSYNGCDEEVLARIDYELTPSDKERLFAIPISSASVYSNVQSRNGDPKEHYIFIVNCGFTSDPNDPRRSYFMWDLWTTSEIADQPVNETDPASVLFWESMRFVKGMIDAVVREETVKVVTKEYITRLAE